MLGVRLGVVGILAREDVKILTVYVDLSVICVAPKTPKSKAPIYKPPTNSTLTPKT
jgi:hypothetical protein